MSVEKAIKRGKVADYVHAGRKRAAARKVEAQEASNREEQKEADRLLCFPSYHPC